MKGQCLTGCGLDINYEPIEFSDGFVYYLPRNLDKSVHNCFLVSNDVVEVVVQGWGPEDCTKDNNVPILKRVYEKNNNNGLTYEQFCSVVKSLQENPTNNFWEGDGPFDISLVRMLIDGNMFELKRILEKQMNSLPAPFFQSREDPMFGNMCDGKLELIYGEYDNHSLAEKVYLNLPTNMGYQLEHLGLLYELMIQLEDAKKCFELQYECTGEPELKKYVEKLEKKIEEKNLRYPKKNNLSTEKLTRDTTLEILKKTEENVREYVFGVYDNNIQEIWSRFPQYKKSVDEIRQKNENSLTPPEEKSPIQHLTMGQLADIMYHSNNQRRSDRNHKCDKCGEEYLKNEQIFFQNIKNSQDKIICKNKQCFESQGGVHKNIPEELVSLFQLLTSVRNILTHAKEDDLKKDEIAWEIRFNSVAGDCRLVNYSLENINADKKYT